MCTCYTYTLHITYIFKMFKKNREVFHLEYCTTGLKSLYASSVYYTKVRPVQQATSILTYLYIYCHFYVIAYRSLGAKIECLWVFFENEVKTKHPDS